MNLKSWEAYIVERYNNADVYMEEGYYCVDIPFATPGEIKKIERETNLSLFFIDISDDHNSVQLSFEDRT